MTAKQITDGAKQSVTMPVWLVTIIISVFILLVEFNVKAMANRLDRIETKLDNHITNTK